MKYIIVFLCLCSMTLSNFINNVKHEGSVPLSDDVASNSDIVADMEISDSFKHRYRNSNEFGIGANYYVKLVNEKKVLYKGDQECPEDTLPQAVISEINKERGTTTSIIGSIFSNNYGIYMSKDRSLQIYQRIEHSDSDSDTSDKEEVEKRYGYRCQNKKYGAPKSCGNKVKGGNPINSAHNCPGKGYECVFPQGPEGNNFGVCCYSISTAEGCGFEGGYCFLDKVKNTYGNNCIN